MTETLILWTLLLTVLAVIGVALSVFILFTAVMRWVRQYLLLHTGNRIDAVLGLRVFEHLFRLPARYFEQRPTGVLVAEMPTPVSARVGARHRTIIPRTENWAARRRR